jgi:hypothetical protein
MIAKIKNPKTELYNQIKKHIKSSDFPWFYNSDSTVSDIQVNSNSDNYQNLPFYSHKFISRPKMDFDNGSRYLFPEVTSNLTELYYPILEEIFNYNNIKIGCLLRFNANCVHPSGIDKTTVPHVDHNFPHKNIIIYLTDSGGDTILYDDNKKVKSIHSPKEDDIIIFQGVHAITPPRKERRIIFVATFIEV